MPKIREIVLREGRTEKDVSILVAKIDNDGDLILEGYDVGEAPKEFWGDSSFQRSFGVCDETRPYEIPQRWIALA